MYRKKEISLASANHSMVGTSRRLGLNDSTTINSKENQVAWKYLSSLLLSLMSGTMPR
jgi:hypothetical protein